MGPSLQACLCWVVLLGACSSSSKPPASQPPAAGAAGRDVGGRGGAGGAGGKGEPAPDSGTKPPVPDAGVPDASQPPAADDDAGVQPPKDTPRELTWQRASDCPVARFEAGGILFKGELWVLGGFVTESLEVSRRVDIYDPERDSWRRGPNLPGAETHFGIVADGDELLVFGGLDKMMGGGPTAAVWRLPSGSMEWKAESALPAQRAAFAWAMIGDKLYIAGGLAADNNSDLPDHSVRDLAAAMPSWQMLAGLPDPRNHGGGVESGGKFYAVAGRHNWDENAGHTTSLHVFDPTRATWQPLAAMPIARSEISSATFTTSDGRIITVGGSTAGVKPSRDVLEYDPARDRWRALTELPEPRKGAVAVRVGKKVVVTTGSPTGTDPVATTFVGCCVE